MSTDKPRTFIPRALYNTRDYFTEFFKNRKYQWEKYNSPDTSVKKLYQSLLKSPNHRDFYRRFPVNRTQLSKPQVEDYITNLMKSNAMKGRPFEFFSPKLNDSSLREDRIPSEGIELVPYFYHPGNVILPSPDHSRPLDPDSEADAAESYLPGDIDYGPPISQELLQLIYERFPQYLQYVTQYCRPAGTTDATFRDFNKPQKPSNDFDEPRKTRILTLVDHFLNITPYLPLHYVDTQYCKLPLVTGTGYHNRRSYHARTYAHFSHPENYSKKPTSKGFYYNYTRFNNRKLVHLAKEHSFPVDVPEHHSRFRTRASKFLKEYPTLMFTRNHISRRDGTLKVRPVYAVDELFLDIELMLAFPATVQARKPSCSIMYGLETIRGSNVYLDRIAMNYQSFATIDWSGYDQHLPWRIVYLFFMHWLPSKIIISHGYAPTVDYPEHKDLNEHKMFKKMFNLLTCLMNWYFNMVFLSADGYAYRRTFAGVPSGMLLTQFLDSFGNLVLIIDGLIEFGCPDDEITTILLFIMGDDNSIFCHWSLDRLDSFITFLESYSKSRWNMTLSKTKSIITSLRSRIETLSYQCNFGWPKRPIPKLVAQLVYPEHGIKPQFMSARAIGIAYAACAMDYDFHEFCRQVYRLYLPVADMSQQAIRNTRVWILKLLELEETEHLIPLDHFPTMDEIIKTISYYHGPLDYAPKWDRAHFTADPDFAPTGFKTMSDYMSQHNISRVPTTRFEV